MQTMFIYKKPLFPRFSKPQSNKSHQTSLEMFEQVEDHLHLKEADLIIAYGDPFSNFSTLRDKANTVSTYKDGEFIQYLCAD